MDAEIVDLLQLMTSERSSAPLHTHKTTFGNYHFYEHFVVGEWTDEHASAEQVEMLKGLFDDYFEGAPYGYIGNRVNPHSVDVAEVRKVLKSAENLKEVAFVTYTPMGQSVAYIEKAFYDSHNLHVFPTLEEALEWMCGAMQAHC